MRNLLRWIVLLLFFLTGVNGVNKKVIYVLNIQDSINPFTSAYIQRGLGLAQKHQAELILIKLDTPGGLLTSTRAIIQKMLETPVVTVVFVYPSGGHAGSAGAFILMAADIAAMAPGTTVGSASPIPMGGMEGESVPETVMKKITEDAAALMRTIARKKHRNEEIAVRFVTEGISISETEALQEKVIDLIAKDTNDLLILLNNRTVEKNDRTFTLFTLDATAKEIPMSHREIFFSTIASPTVAYILLIIGMWGILYEFLHPGQYYPGIIGLICLILAFVALQNLPVSYGAVALLVLGLVLIIVELKTPGFGFFGALGVGIFLLGSFLMFAAPFRVPFEIVGIIGGAFLVFLLFVVPMVIIAHLRRPFVGRENLVEKVGEVIRDLTPVGLVHLEGELWKARSLEGNIPKGTQIRVRKVDGMLVWVEKSEQNENPEMQGGIRK